MIDIREYGTEYRAKDDCPMETGFYSEYCEDNESDGWAVNSVSWGDNFGVPFIITFRFRPTLRCQMGLLATGVRAIIFLASQNT